MKKQISVFYLIFFGWLFAACLTSAVAQNVDGFSDLPSQTSGPIQIEADKLEVLENENRSVFSGNVFLAQADFKLWTDSIIVKYGAGGPSDLSQADARGSVRIEFNGQKVTGNRARYDARSQTFRVFDNVVLTQKSTTIKGSELVIDLQTGKADLKSGGSGRVRGVFEAPSN